MPWPWGKSCPVIIRCDDISYFTSKKMLRQLYTCAWNDGYKIDFGVIPFLSGNAPSTLSMKRNPLLANLSYEPCIPPCVRGTASKYDIRKNEELLSFLSSLRRNGEADLSLHGYSHDLKDFQGEDNAHFERLLKYAIENFVSSFGFRPKVLVFPYYICSKKALSVASRFDLCMFFDRPVSLIGRALKKGGMLKTVKKVKNRSIIVFPNNKISVCSPIFSHLTPKENYESAKMLFLEKYRRKEPFWVVHHFWEFYFDWNDEISYPDFLFELNKLLSFMSKADIWKCSTADLVEWILTLEQLDTKRVSNDEIVLNSQRPIAGLSFKVRGEPDNSGLIRAKTLSESIYVMPRLMARQELRIKCSRR